MNDYQAHREGTADAIEAVTAKHCRTCGFTDCPGASTGNCPRWPARECGCWNFTHLGHCVHIV